MGTPPHRRLVAYGAERVSATTCPPRHQHATAYVTVVLDGAYEQLAYAGRLRVEAGDVLVQPTFDCHLNRPITANVTLLRLAWPHDLSFGGLFRSVAVDDVIAAARHDVTEAASLLACRLEAHAPIPTRFNDWPDLFAADVRCEPRTAIFHWAKTAGVSREHLSRVFAATYGVPPLRFRFELRARMAWRKVVEAESPLALVAQDCGFADQAHMSRSVTWLTGATPSAWRRASQGFKTGLAASATR